MNDLQKKPAFSEPVLFNEISIQTPAPRLMIAGTHSGAGKTTVTLALMAAFLKENIHVQPFKVGPDYIDTQFTSRLLAMYQAHCQLPQDQVEATVDYFNHSNQLPLHHAAVNLDTWLMPTEMLIYSFASYAKHAQINIIEGVMGYYDGRLESDFKASSYEVSKLLKTPVILVVDAKGSSSSLAATILGFKQLMNDAPIQGVIFNRMSPKLYQMMKPHLEALTGVPCFGCLPMMDQVQLPSRHLGLSLPDRIDTFADMLNTLANRAIDTIDLEGIIQCANMAPPIHIERPKQLTQLIEIVQISLKERITPPTVGICYDDCFNFYYQDLWTLLRTVGIQLVPIRPLAGDTLDHLDGLIIGGGYPELYGAQLSAQTRFLNQLKERIQKGFPIYAECGGYMYLGQSIKTLEGMIYPLVGALKAEFECTDRLQHFGYATLIPLTEGLLSKEIEQIPVHEFHYSRTKCKSGDMKIYKHATRSWQDGVNQPSIYASYAHLHPFSSLSIWERFIQLCINTEPMTMNHLNE